MALLRTILKQCILHPRRIAVVDDFRQYSYLQILGGSMFMAKAIEAATTRPHVGILLPTSGAFPMALLGCWLARRVGVPINYLLKPSEMTQVNDDSGIDTIITVGPMLDHLGGRSALPERLTIVRMDQMKFTGIPPLRWPPSFSPEDLAVLLYTSGTSGKPKGVMLTHGNFESDVRGGVIHAELTQADTFLGVIPQFHSFGLTALTLLPLSIGSRVVFTARFVPRKFIDLIRTHRPQVMMGVPSLYGALLTVKDSSADDFSSIRYAISGGEALSDAVFEQFQTRFNVKLLEGYGLTETTPVIYWSTAKKWKRNAVGTPLPGVVPLLLDDNDQPVPIGSGREGEILVAGPMIMKGYYEQPEATGAVIFETQGYDGVKRRYFRTGDVGKIDAENFLFITGRKKELFKVAGEMVSPREIEEVLAQHPTVRAAAIVPKADGVRGLIPVAFIEPQEGVTIDENELRTWCRDRLASYKVPREIRVLQALPRNPTGKILRRELKVD